MQKHFVRVIQKDIEGFLEVYPMIAVLGPKRSGKTALLNAISANISFFRSFNLKKMEDLQILNDAKNIFTTNEKVVFCLDNIHLAPELLTIIHSLLVKKATAARFIFSGTISSDSLQKTHPIPVQYLKILTLCELTISEMFHPTDFSLSRHWLRGGFPESYFATSDLNSNMWRKNYLKEVIETCGAKFGIGLSGMQLYYLLHIFAQNQFCCLNTSKIAQIFQITHPSIQRYIHIMEQNFFLRLIPAFPSKTKKRIVKTPKVYIRDSGLLHTLLSISTAEELRINPQQSVSWKGYVIENVLTAFPDWSYCYYESIRDASLDLILIKSKTTIAVKVSLSRSNINGKLISAINDINPTHTYIVVSTSAMQYKETEKITECDLPKFLEIMSKINKEMITKFAES